MTSRGRSVSTNDRKVAGAASRALRYAARQVFLAAILAFGRRVVSALRGKGGTPDSLLDSGQKKNP
jgi:hypothetical protein